MNLLKSIYISAYSVLAVALASTAVQSLINGGPWRSWIGLLLATAPFALFVVWIMLTRSIARTGRRFPWISAAGLVGLALAVWGYLLGEGSNTLWLTFLAVLAFQVYNLWYSEFGRRASEALKVGQRIEGLRFTDADGALVDADQLKGQPTIWMFIRGNWCPLCVAQVKELAADYARLETAGIQVAVVSPQSEAQTRRLAKRLGVNFRFLIDGDLSASRQLGVFAANGLPFGMQALGYQSDTVMPTVIITDADNRIVWAHETDNYRVRPEPDLFAEVLRSKGLLPAIDTI